MTSSLAPLDATALPEELDYAGLLRESLDRIKNLAGQQWSNFNASDPGYTILEQLSYALTELGYRAGLPVPTLFCDGESGSLDLQQHGLYSAPEIFPSAPLSIPDQRRMLLDQSAEIANVWFEPLPSGDASISPQIRSTKTAGLYQLVVLPADANQWFVSRDQAQHTSVDVISNRVHDCFASLRNLCEDVASIRVLQPLAFEIRSLRLLLEPDADPDLMLATLLYQLGLLVNPEPRRQSLQQRRASTPDEEAPLGGPMPGRGFIADEQLGDRPLRLDTVHLRQSLCAIDGIIELEHMGFCLDATTGELGKETVLKIPQDNYLLLSLNPQKVANQIVLLKNSGQVTYSPTRMTRLLSNLWREHRQVYTTFAEAESMFALPSATGGDLGAYTSLLRQFPAAYQLDGSDSDDAISREEIAKRCQLKAYLMVFDQFMADALAQLAFVPRLFSLQSGDGSTWQARSLKSIPGCDASLLVDGYNEKCESLRQRLDGGFQRQSAIFDFLLSLSGQSLSLGQASGRRTPGLDASSPAVVAAQRLLLSDLMELSRDRGLGINYRAPSYRQPKDRDRYLRDLSTADQFTALERRCSLQLLASSQFQDGANPTSVTDPAAATFGTRLSSSRGQDIRPCLQPIRPSSAASAEGQQTITSAPSLSKQNIYGPLFTNLANKLNYRIATSASGMGYDLYCPDVQHDLWLLATFSDDAGASRCACRLAEEALWHLHRSTASIYLVEWTLLRSAMDLPTSQNLQPDQFNHRVTAVLPQANGATISTLSPSTQPDALRQALRPLLPAHVQLDVVRLDPQAYAQFLEIRRSWLLALADGQADAMAAESLRMLGLISPQSTAPPLAPDGAASNQGFGNLLVTWPQNTQAMGLMLSQSHPGNDLGLLLLLADPSTPAAANAASPSGLPPASPASGPAPTTGSSAAPPTAAASGPAPTTSSTAAATTAAATDPAPPTAAAPTDGPPATPAAPPLASTGSEVTPSVAPTTHPPSGPGNVAMDPNAVGPAAETATGSAQLPQPGALAPQPASGIPGIAAPAPPAVIAPPAATAPTTASIPQGSPPGTSASPAPGDPAGSPAPQPPAGTLEGSSPGGGQPGPLPPGAMPPGIAQPVAMPLSTPQAATIPPWAGPGSAPAATLPAEGLPPAGPQPTALPTDRGQPGYSQPGQLPPWATPSGNPQPAAWPAVATMPGSPPMAAVPPGTIPPGAIQPAGMPMGVEAPGTLPPSAAPATAPPPGASAGVPPSPGPNPWVGATLPQNAAPPPPSQPLNPWQAAWAPNAPQVWAGPPLPWTPPPGAFDPAAAAQPSAGQSPGQPMPVGPAATPRDGMPAASVPPPGGAWGQPLQPTPGNPPNGPTGAAGPPTAAFPAGQAPTVAPAAAAVGPVAAPPGAWPSAAAQGGLPQATTSQPGWGQPAAGSAAPAGVPQPGWAAAMPPAAPAPQPAPNQPPPPPAPGTQPAGQPWTPWVGSSDPRAQAPWPMAPGPGSAPAIPGGQAPAAVTGGPGSAAQVMPSPGQASPPAVGGSPTAPVRLLIQPARPQALGLRLPQPAGDDLLHFCRANRLEFLILPLHGAVRQIAPTSADLARTVAAGLAVMLLCDAPEPSGGLSEQMGYSHALSSAQVARELGLPAGLTIWLADSNAGPGLSSGDSPLSAYVSGWAHGMTACGYDAGLFASNTVNLSNVQINRLCQLPSSVTEPMLGYSMRQVQLEIPELNTIDQAAQFYQVLSDRRASTPTWLAQGPPPLT